MNKVIFPIVTLIGFLSLVMLYLAGAGYSGGSFELSQAFTLLCYAALLGITSTALVIFLPALETSGRYSGFCAFPLGSGWPHRILSAL